MPLYLARLRVRSHPRKQCTKKAGLAPANRELTAQGRVEQNTPGDPRPGWRKDREP